MKMHPQQLSGDALDWAVAKCEGETMLDGLTDELRYSTDWSRSGMLIQQERIGVFPGTDNIDPDRPTYWLASCGGLTAKGRTALEAAMRAYVLCVGGPEIDVPDELV